VENRGSVDPDITRFGKARDTAALIHDSFHPVLRNAPHSMRARSDEQGRVSARHRIDVYPEGEHALDEFERWLDVDCVGLPAPMIKPRNVDALPNCDRAILVPSKRPVRLRSLVEEYGAYGPDFITDQTSGDPSGRSIC
jgi:hypothetical protein